MLISIHSLHLFFKLKVYAEKEELPQYVEALDSVDREYYPSQQVKYYPSQQVKYSPLSKCSGKKLSKIQILSKPTGKYCIKSKYYPEKHVKFYPKSKYLY